MFIRCTKSKTSNLFNESDVSALFRAVILVAGLNILQILDRFLVTFSTYLKQKRLCVNHFVNKQKLYNNCFFIYLNINSKAETYLRMYILVHVCKVLLACKIL